MMKELIKAYWIYRNEILSHIQACFKNYSHTLQFSVLFNCKRSYIYANTPINVIMNNNNNNSYLVFYPIRPNTRYSLHSQLQTNDCANSLPITSRRVSMQGPIPSRIHRASVWCQEHTRKNSTKDTSGTE